MELLMGDSPLADTRAIANSTTSLDLTILTNTRRASEQEADQVCHFTD
jgi:hypothetical protein